MPQQPRAVARRGVSWMARVTPGVETSAYQPLEGPWLMRYGFCRALFVSSSVWVGLKGIEARHMILGLRAQAMAT